MLAARRLPEILDGARTDGIDGVCLMTQEGSLLSSSFVDHATTDEVGLAAIASSVWGNYVEGANDTYMHLAKLESGYLGICTAGKGYLVAAYGGTVTPGMLRSKLQLLSRYFSKVFDLIK